MAKVKIELNSAGFTALLKGAEVEQMVGGHAARVAANAGPSYESDTKQMPTRVIASAFTGTKEAMQDQMENNTLLRALR